METAQDAAPVHAIMDVHASAPPPTEEPMTAGAAAPGEGTGAEALGDEDMSEEQYLQSNWKRTVHAIASMRQRAMDDAEARRPLAMEKLDSVKVLNPDVSALRNDGLYRLQVYKAAMDVALSQCKTLSSKWKESMQEALEDTRRQDAAAKEAGSEAAQAHNTTLAAAATAVQAAMRLRPTPPPSSSGPGVVRPGSPRTTLVSARPRHQQAQGGEGAAGGSPGLGKAWQPAADGLASAQADAKELTEVMRELIPDVVPQPLEYGDDIALLEAGTEQHQGANKEKPPSRQRGASPSRQLTSSSSQRRKSKSGSMKQSSSGQSVPAPSSDAAPPQRGTQTPDRANTPRKTMRSDSSPARRRSLAGGPGGNSMKANKALLAAAASAAPSGSDAEATPAGSSQHPFVTAVVERLATGAHPGATDSDAARPATSPALTVANDASSGKTSSAASEPGPRPRTSMSGAPPAPPSKPPTVPVGFVSNTLLREITPDNPVPAFSRRDAVNKAANNFFSRASEYMDDEEVPLVASMLKAKSRPNTAGVRRRSDNGGDNDWPGMEELLHSGAALEPLPATAMQGPYTLTIVPQSEPLPGSAVLGTGSTQRLVGTDNSNMGAGGAMGADSGIILQRTSSFGGEGEAEGRDGGSNAGAGGAGLRQQELTMNGMGQGPGNGSATVDDGAFLANPRVLRRRASTGALLGQELESTDGDDNNAGGNGAGEGDAPGQGLRGLLRKMTSIWGSKAPPENAAPLPYLGDTNPWEGFISATVQGPPMDGASTYDDGRGGLMSQRSRGRVSVSGTASTGGTPNRQRRITTDGASVASSSTAMSMPRGQWGTPWASGSGGGQSRGRSMYRAGVNSTGSGLPGPGRTSHSGALSSNATSAVADRSQIPVQLDRFGTGFNLGFGAIAAASAQAQALGPEADADRGANGKLKRSSTTGNNDAKQRLQVSHYHRSIYRNNTSTVQDMRASLAAMRGDGPTATSGPLDAMQDVSDTSGTLSKMADGSVRVPSAPDAGGSDGAAFDGGQSNSAPLPALVLPQLRPGGKGPSGLRSSGTDSPLSPRNAGQSSLNGVGRTQSPLLMSHSDPPLNPGLSIMDYVTMTVEGTLPAHILEGDGPLNLQSYMQDQAGLAQPSPAGSTRGATRAGRMSFDGAIGSRDKDVIVVPPRRALINGMNQGTVPVLTGLAPIPEAASSQGGSISGSRPMSAVERSALGPTAPSPMAAPTSLSAAASPRLRHSMSGSITPGRNERLVSSPMRAHNSTPPLGGYGPEPPSTAPSAMNGGHRWSLSGSTSLVERAWSPQSEKPGPRSHQQNGGSGGGSSDAPLSGSLAGQPLRPSTSASHQSVAVRLPPELRGARLDVPSIPTSQPTLTMDPSSAAPGRPSLSRQASPMRATGRSMSGAATGQGPSLLVSGRGQEALEPPPGIVGSKFG